MDFDSEYFRGRPAVAGTSAHENQPFGTDIGLILVTKSESHSIMEWLSK